MPGLTSAFRSVAVACNRVHGSADAITLARVGQQPCSTSATVYRERSEWRRGKNDREQVFTRRVVLLPDADPVPIGSIFVADGLQYTVESVSKSHAGSQTLRGTRTAAANVSRPGYYGRD